MAEVSPSRKKKLSNSEIAELIERGYAEVFKWEDDDLALKSAAAHSRLAYDKMSSQEMAAFSEIAENHISTAIFLHVRNKILQMWHLEPNVECTLDQILGQIMPPFNSDRSLIRRVHAFLQRYGYINYGVFYRMSGNPPHTKKKVIVIGAGWSGVAAAKQLKSFGFDVTILECRERTGGRVHSHATKTRQHSFVGDLGAMIVMGICGNPLVTLSKQFVTHLDRINGAYCPLFDTKGRPIDKRKDNLVDEAFNAIGNIASHIVHERGYDTINGEPIDLETAYDNILCLMELNVQKKRLRFFKMYEEVVMTMQTITEELTIYKRTVEEIGEKLKELEATPVSEFNSKTEKEVLRRCYKRDLVNAFKKFDDMESRKKNVESFLVNLKRLEPNEVYMNIYDRRLLDFHLANLEYANGTRLRNLSLKHWDQDDDYEIAGSHMTVREGMGHLITKLLDGMPVLLDRRVTNIEYGEEGVKVKAVFKKKEETGDGREEEYSGDAVLCTLPLGVLKRSVKGEEGVPIFSPPLPARKAGAIERVGFGNLNKVILIFDTIFWEDTTHFFGSTSTDEVSNFKGSRGELYMFMAQTNKPILIGLLAGESADFGSHIAVDDEKGMAREKGAVVARAMELLYKKFGHTCPSSPVEAIVTLWHRDEAALGCYSYMAKHAEAADYDILAESVRCKDENGEYSGSERLFFAGEHTNRNYPATTHGAMLSGHREAARIADILIGCPYGPSEDPAVILVDMEEEEKEDEAEIITLSPDGREDERMSSIEPIELNGVKDIEMH